MADGCEFSLCNSSWAPPFRATGTVRKKQTRPSRTKSHLPSHSPPASQAGAVLDQPSSLRPHWWTLQMEAMYKEIPTLTADWADNSIWCSEKDIVPFLFISRLSCSRYAHRSGLIFSSLAKANYTWILVYYLLSVSCSVIGFKEKARIKY